MTDNSSQNTTTSQGVMRPKGRVARSVFELVAKVLEPSIARKTGMRTDLLKAWPELAGPEYADRTRPEKINWPRRANEDDPFKPATLVIACEPACALFFQHSQGEIIERVNRFFGFHAVERIRLVQKPVRKNVVHPEKTGTAKTDKEATSGLAKKLSRVSNDRLRRSLARLGEGVLRRKT